MMYPLCGYDACLTANDAPPRRNDVFALRQILRVASLRIITLSDGKPSPLPRGEASGHGKPCPYGNPYNSHPFVGSDAPVAPARVGATPRGRPKGFNLARQTGRHTGRPLRGYGRSEPLPYGLTIKLHTINCSVAPWATGRRRGGATISYKPKRTASAVRFLRDATRGVPYLLLTTYY